MRRTFVKKRFVELLRIIRILICLLLLFQVTNTMVVGRAKPNGPNGQTLRAQALRARTFQRPLPPSQVPAQQAKRAVRPNGMQVSSPQSPQEPQETLRVGDRVGFGQICNEPGPQNYIKGRIICIQSENQHQPLIVTASYNPTKIFYLSLNDYLSKRGPDGHNIMRRVRDYSLVPHKGTRRYRIVDQ